LIGKQLGGYAIQSDLGTGGMGRVYLAETVEAVAGLEVGTRIALKVVHPHLLETPGYFKRFLQEAELGKRVRHPNVVRTFDADAIAIDGQHHHYMVMEYVEGKSLRALLRDLGMVPETLLREIALQTAAGLAAIHAAGVIHRDIKPENILITNDHEIRIMDLGVAKLQEATLAITRDGQFTGSVMYAAPEQFRLDDVGSAADLYALGVVLHELCTGDHPFRRDSAAASIDAQLKETPPRLGDLDSEVSEFLSECVATLLAKAPGDRFESAATLCDTLENGEQSTWWTEVAPKIRGATEHLPKIRVRRETKLYGRGEDVGVLRDAWERAKAGEGNTVLVEGEAGIGKTRLIDAMLRELVDEEHHVLYGCYPPSGGLGAISESVRGKFGEAQLASALTPYLAAAPSLVPSFAALVNHEAPPTNAQPLTGDALQTACVHLMHALAEERPLIWIIDDLHFAPKEGRDVVFSLARATAGHRVLVIATARPGVPEAEQAHLSRLDNFQRIALRRLGARDIVELLEDSFKSEALAEKLGIRIAKKSDGVPFFIFELIRGLKEGQFIKQLPDGSYAESQVIQEFEVPSAVKDLIEGRMSSLTEDQRAILDVGAVQGMSFEPALVAEVLEEKKVRVLRQIAEIERRHGLVRGEASRCVFDQNQIQEVLYRDLLPELRAEYHALLAEAHAARCDHEPRGDDAVFLAHHYLKGSQPKRAEPYLDAAFKFLASGYRNDRLLELMRLALGVPGLLEGTPRARMLLRFADRLHIVAQRDEQRRVIDEALALASTLDDAVLHADVLRANGSYLWSTGHAGDARDTFLRALEVAHDAGDRELEARATGSLGVAYWLLSRFAEAEEQSSRCAALARESGDRQTEARAAGNLGNVCASLGRHQDAAANFERSRALSAESGDRTQESNALGNLAGNCVVQGRYAQAKDSYERSVALARDIGYRQGESVGTGNLGNVLSLLGRFTEARHWAERGLALAHEIGSRRTEGYARHNLGEIAGATGDWAEACEMHAETCALRRELGQRGPVAETLVKLGRFEFLLDETERARNHWEEAWTIARETDSPELIAAVRIEQARLDGGDVDTAVRALDTHEAALDHADRMYGRFRLWELTDDEAHLTEAHRLLMFARDHAPEDDRESMLDNVPLYRDIVSAWAKL